LNQTPTKISHKNRNIGIAVVAILVLIIALVAGLYFGGVWNGSTVPNPTSTSTPTPAPTPTPIPFDFGISLSQIRGTVLQGESIQASVYITWTSGNPQTVTLSGDGGSSGIQCSFNPSANTPDFTSTLTMSVPALTPTNAYSVTVTATGGGVTHATSYTVSVLSAKVYVSGTVTTKGLGTSPTQIQFVDTQTGLTYTGSMSGSSYSITLQNKHTYNVVCYWKGLLGSSGTFSGGTLYVNVGVGVTSMTQDFSG